MKPLSILLITPRSVAGTGSGTYLKLLAGGLKGRPDIYVHVYRDPEDLSGQWDVVHAVDIKHMDPAISASIRSPLIVDIHDVYWMRGEQRFPTPDLPLRFYFDTVRKRRYMPIIESADVVVVHSEYVASRLASGGIKNIEVARYAVEAMEPGPPLGERDPHVVFAGRDYFRKGLPVLLDAWRFVERTRSGARLFIAGREFLHGRLYAGLRSRGRSVELLGDCPRQDLLDRVKHARALVLPAWTEAFGIALIEAAALGTPAIGSRTGGIPEALGDGRFGLLVEKGDARGLAAAILRCLEDKPDDGLLSLISVAGDNATACSIDSMIDRVTEIYRKVAGA